MPTTIFPCASKSICFDDANPFANLSSEATDGPTFIGLSFGLWPFKPALGSNWRVSSCLGVCESQVSASEAFFCAARNELECESGDRGPSPQYPMPRFPGDPGGGGPFLPPTTPALIYGNNPRIVSCNCPDGLPFSVSVPAEQFTAYNQAQANQMADSWAQQEAVRLRFCLSDLPSRASCVGEPYSQTITATGISLFPALFSTDFHQTPLTFTIVEGDLPPGLVLVTTGPNTCAIIGTPTSGGNTFMLRATGTDGSFMDKVYGIQIVSLADSSPLPQFSQNVAYSYQFSTTGFLTSQTYAVTGGSLPAGLSLSSGGLLSGTPTGTASATFTVTVTDATGNNCAKQFTISKGLGCIIANATPLPSGTYPVAYGPIQFTIDLPDPVLSWQVIAGSLPPGITLSLAGVLSGTPLAGGSFTFTVQAFVSATIICSKQFTLVIACPADVSEASWASSGNFTPNLAVVAGVSNLWSKNFTGVFAFGSTVAQAYICNSGTAYVITVTIPWVVAGVVLGTPTSFICSLIINGVTTQQVIRDLIAGPFTDVVLTGTIPASAAANVSIQLEVICDPFAPGNFTVSGPSPATITPLTHP